ncbi:MAG: ABC transporter ATPase [Lutibacter sp.]|nr:ABC transporter ATPase [Lutibacter sp.]MBP9601634.1 ABC transporter ATPase [Lutibacter sp.]
MFVNFESLANSSKVWIYQSNREFSSHEGEIIKDKIESFVANWNRHGDDLNASYKIVYNQFIVLAVDEDSEGISGCSIDSSVNLIKQLEKEFDIDLTNRLNISFKDGETINVVNMGDFQKYVQQGKVTAETIVFNNMVTTKGDFESNWEVSVANSWHKRYLATKASS